MVDHPFFECWNEAGGAHNSRYIQRVTVPRYDLAEGGARETRTYACEHCGSRNEISLNKGDWAGVDGRSHGE
jgi:hypothetical protein